MEQLQIKSLLNQVTTLNNHYKKINDLTGENFNVFRILKLEASEVRLHSAFLASLLDPIGSHGQKDTFLKLFIKQFCFKNNAINISNCKVEIEKHIGFISHDRTEGGRIDIAITDDAGNNILIENKIYAGDQNFQLKRYHRHAPNADLIYLTLDGKLPSELSFDDLIQDTHFKCLSYKSDIVSWLEECRKEVAVYPIVRESITQYINLIKYLTNQTLNHTMQRELDHLLLSNLEASFTIADSLDQTLENVLASEFTPKLEEACEKIGLHCVNGINFKRNYSGIWIWKEEWQHVNIGFQFWSTDKDMIYGFTCKQDPVKEPIPDEVKNNLNALADRSLRQNGWWPLYHKMESPYNNWHKYEAWKAITDGTMLSVLLEKIEYLLRITEGKVL
ncbi:hypothetical protein EOD41_00070 [Mucilaginibacter limnophilus]|uniref:PD-(D/E)XK nuclease family protein n=1 Tax=Mucilaginibacter limnophilus TaxID=1932778 RepID=A0A437MXH5_9SPHI|nr:PD-(D/E)XK nuclease family protein [Mucilaginibacter limnophilus]RVU02372.1 hypothetical protein EOD41_00070 [Mucilaginibacter limnophilus]